MAAWPGCCLQGPSVLDVPWHGVSWGCLYEEVQAHHGIQDLKSPRVAKRTHKGGVVPSLGVCLPIAMISSFYGSQICTVISHRPELGKDEDMEGSDALMRDPYHMWDMGNFGA